MNKKKITTLNNCNRQDIVERLNTLSANCSDSRIAQILFNLKCDLENQPSSDSAELYEQVDRFIKALVEDIAKDLSTKSFNTVNAKLPKLKVYITKRLPYCGGTIKRTREEEKQIKIKENLIKQMEKEIKRRQRIAQKRGIAVSELYTAEELTDMFIRSLQDKEQEILSEIQACKELDDEVSLSFIKGYEIKLQQIKKEINMYLNERNRSTLVKAIEGLDQAHRDMIAKRDAGASEAAFEATIQKFKELEDKLGSEDAATEAGIDMFMGRESVQSGATSLGASTSTVSGGQSVAKSTLSKQSMQEVFSNIDSIVAKFRDVSAMYEREIEEKNKEIEIIEDKLRDLLAERESANASECIALDNRINNLISDRDIVMRGRDRICLAQNEIRNKLKIAENIKNVTDVENIKQIVAQVAGKSFENLEDVAMYLKQYDEAANTNDEDLEAIAGVATSTRINRTAIPNMDARYDSDLIKDEHKYDKLKKELGGC